MTKTKTYPKLNKNLEVDVAIVGGGLVGIDTAYLLNKTGLKVTVLESQTIGSGATSKTTAFLTQVIDTNYADMIKMFGSRKTKLVWKAHGEAIDTVESIIKKEKIECHFSRCSNYLFGQSEDESKEIVQEFDAYKKLGFKAKLHRKNIFPFSAKSAIEIPNQGKYYASEFISQLAAAAAENGVQIFEHTKVTKIQNKPSIVIHAAGRKIKAKNVIIATYDPITNPWSTKFKKGMYVSYVMQLQIPKNAIPHATYEDNQNPYHYFRIDSNGKTDSMVVGGEDHREELPMNPAKNYKALKEYVDKTFPNLKYEIKSRWKGPILEPTDGLPLIGKFGPHQYVACAFSGNGMTYSMIAAKIFRDLLTKKQNPQVEIFDPTRTPSVKQLTKKFIDYAQELVGGAATNFFKSAD